METTFFTKSYLSTKKISFFYPEKEKARRNFGNENNFNIQCNKHAQRNSLIQWNTQRNPTYENRTMANGKSNIANWFNHSIDNEFRRMKRNACVRTFFGVEDVIDSYIHYIGTKCGIKGDEKWQVIVWALYYSPINRGIVVYLYDCYSPHRSHFFLFLFLSLSLKTICISLWNVSFYLVLELDSE